jgi:hypothetical protein
LTKILILSFSLRRWSSCAAKLASSDEAVDSSMDIRLISFSRNLMSKFVSVRYITLPRHSTSTEINSTSVKSIQRICRQKLVSRSTRLRHDYPAIFLLPTNILTSKFVSVRYITQPRRKLIVKSMQKMCRQKPVASQLFSGTTAAISRCLLSNNATLESATLV